MHMRPSHRALFAVLAIAAATEAHAQFALDLKVGYALPSGKVAAPSVSATDPQGALSNWVSGAVPIEGAARYRFTPRLSAGVYFQYAPTFVSDYVCLSSFSCSGSNVRVGAEAVYGFLPDAFLNPWVSVGTGWEWLNQKVSAGAATVNRSVSGWEWFNVQTGLDFNLSKTFAVGPYIGFFGGQYSSGTVEGVSTTIPSSNRTFHGWWQLGAKGTVNL
jgi:hypothetical protein